MADIRDSGHVLRLDGAEEVYEQTLEIPFCCESAYNEDITAKETGFSLEAS